MKFDDQLNLADYFLYDRIKEGLANKKAILFGERSYTYNDIVTSCDGLRRYLQSLGFRREEKVLIVLPDTPPFAWSLMASFAEGGVACMGNPHAPTEHIRYLLDYTRASIVITIPKVAAAVAKDMADMPELRSVLVVPDVETGADPTSKPKFEILGDSDLKMHSLQETILEGHKMGPPVLRRTHRDDVCMWLFTSGSTGRPKAAMHTHRDFAFNTEVYAKNTVGYSVDDVTVSVPRLFFGYATGTNLFFPMAVGATAALFSERSTCEKLAEMVLKYKPTIVTNVPTMMGKLLDYDEKLQSDAENGLNFSSVRFHLSAGEALPPSLLDRFTKRFGAEVYDGIGSAEMFHIYCSNRPDGVFPGSLGQAVDGYELKILPRDADGPGGTEVEIGEVGVLWVKGDSVALGYVQDRDKSFKTFHGHWCRTGDLFRKDDRGCLWFCGRDDDLFKVSGIWVSPIEVENCLMTHDKVALAAVVPIKDDGLVKPRAYVVTRVGIDGDAILKSELQTFCKNRLSKHKYPRDVIFVSDLPKNDRGKIDRKQLKSEASL